MKMIHKFIFFLKKKPNAHKISLCGFMVWRELERVADNKTEC